MKKIFTLMLAASFVAGVFAQQPEAVFMKASVAPVIDGEVDEVWAEAMEYPIDKPFQAEVPSVDGTTWKALWNEDGVYVLVTCLDDEWLPMYLDNPAGSNSWEYDKPEVYFDVNYILADGVGGGSRGSGHYQVAPGPTADMNDGTPLACGFYGDADGAISYSITVEDPDHRYEYFIPMSELLDENDIGMDLTATIGFDVTMIDRDTGDPGRKRAVWANIGGSDESWNNMDDCGLVTFDGAEAPTYVESVSVDDAEITENNGMVQLMATVLPEEATNKAIKWSVENGTGKASISSDGVVTGIMDGTVTVTAAATDGSYMEDMCTVTISNQIVSFGEVNVIKNWLFNDVNEDETPAIWGGWRADIGGEVIPAPTVIDGVLNMNPVNDEADPQQWKYQHNQNQLQALPNVDYEFAFVAWADEDATLPVDFEDIAGNDYRRYGATTSEWSADGRSEWQVPITSTPAKYVMDVNFDEILENTDQKVQFMPGLLTMGVYLDSVYLVSADDLDLITDYVEVESIEVTGDATVSVDATAQMSASVTPTDALLTDVRWSVVNGTGEATIDAAGMLTGVAAGTVTVVAAAKDDSGVTGAMDVTVGEGVGIDNKSVETLKVYPNPAINELNVVLSSENGTVSIYNSVGQKMDEVVVSGTQHRFNISSYAAGIYFVKTETSIAKFVK